MTLQLERAWTTACLLLAAVAFSGCSNDMNAGQYTFACDDQNPCAEGFFCGPNGVCVEDGTDVSVSTDAQDTTTDAQDDVEDAVEDTEDTSGDVSDTRDTSDGDASAQDGCEAQTWYRDCDDDEYAGTTTEACDRPQTSAGDCPIDGEDVEQRWKSASELANPNGVDCDDNDPRAYPGQEAYFGTERREVGGFDFNCDTTETPKWEKIGGSCEEDGVIDGCGLNSEVRCALPSDAQGWDRADPPGCGGPGTWITDCQSGCHGTCEGKATGESRTQACR